MNTAQKEEEGHKLVAQAEKELEAKSGFFRSMFGSSSSTKEEAAETFVKAANQFKLAKAWTFAGSAYEKAASTYETISDMKYEAGSKYADAGKAYKNADAKKAIAPFEKAIEIYADSGRFQQCARLKKEIAELHQQNREDSAALEAYTAAADFYDMDDSKSNANTMRINVANLTALAGNYGEAADFYESIAQTALANNLLKYGARDYLLRAGLCRLCLSDLVGAQRALETYAVSAVEDTDVEAFTTHVYEYDSISKLDEWKTTILLKIKNTIKSDDLGEDLT